MMTFREKALIRGVVAGVLRPLRRPERQDERDRMIELRALRVGYFVLLVGVALAIGLSVFGPRTAPALLHVLLAVLVLGEAVRVTVQLVYHCRT